MTEQEARHELKKILKKGSKVYCFLNHVSQSGMTRRISFYAIKKNDLLCLNYLISCVLPYYKLSKKQCLIVRGCGMDIGFSVVYNLSSYLFTGKQSGYNLQSTWV